MYATASHHRARPPSRDYRPGAALLATLLALPGFGTAQEEAEGPDLSGFDTAQEQAAESDLSGFGAAQEPDLPLFGITVPEAPTAADEPPAAEQPDLSTIASRFEARMGFLDLVDAQDYEAAIPMGARMVELTADEFGAESTEYAVELSELAEVRRRAGRYDQAEADFLAAVAIITRLEGNLAGKLVQPLTGLGATYQDIDEHVPAINAFTEARTVSRRSYGLLNEEQIPILDRMTDSFIALGRYREADQKQLDALRLLERTRGHDTPDVLPALYKYARWLRVQGRFEEERLFYMRAMNIIKKAHGRDSIEMVRPLRETGNSFRAQKFPEGLGASSLKRALDIVQAMEEPDALVLAETLRDLGDWYAAFSRVGRGGREYRESWNALGELENGDQLRSAWYSQPAFVLYETPSQRGLRPEGSEPGLTQGFVLVTFDVTPEGRTANVQVVDSDPPGKKDEAIVRSMRRSRFRPRIVDGEVVVAEKLARKFTFSFKPSG